MHSKAQQSVSKVQVPQVWYHGRVRREDHVRDWQYGSAFLRNGGPQVRVSSDHLGSKPSVTKV